MRSPTQSGFYLSLKSGTPQNEVTIGCSTNFSQLLLINKFLNQISVGAKSFFFQSIQLQIFCMRRNN